MLCVTFTGQRTRSRPSHRVEMAEDELETQIRQHVRLLSARPFLFHFPHSFIVRMVRFIRANQFSGNVCPLGSASYSISSHVLPRDVPPKEIKIGMISTYFWPATGSVNLMESKICRCKVAAPPINSMDAVCGRPSNAVYCVSYDTTAARQSAWQIMETILVLRSNNYAKRLLLFEIDFRKSLNSILSDNETVSSPWMRRTNRCDDLAHASGDSIASRLSDCSRSLSDRSVNLTGINALRASHFPIVAISRCCKL